MHGTLLSSSFFSLVTFQKVFSSVFTFFKCMLPRSLTDIYSTSTCQGKQRNKPDRKRRKVGVMMGVFSVLLVEKEDDGKT